MSKKKDGYVYLQTEQQIYGLNISKIYRQQEQSVESYIKECFQALQPGTKPKFPKLELVFNFEGTCMPYAAGCMTLDSKVYLVGGERGDRVTEANRTGEDPYCCEESPSFDFFWFDPEAEAPSIFPCSDGVIPRFDGPKTNPIVVTLEKKIYVMARMPHLGQFGNLQSPIFEVFDPASRSWSKLPDPPFSRHDQSIFNYYAWGNKLVIGCPNAYYIFDTHEELWAKSELPRFHAAAEFEGFLIGMVGGTFAVFSYRLDSEGLPILSSCQRLDGPEKMFTRGDEVVNGTVFRLGDGGHMCLLCTVFDATHSWRVRVLLFRVFTSNLDGVSEPILTAVLDAVQFYDVNDNSLCPGFPNPAVVMFDEQNQREARRLAVSNINTLSDRLQAVRQWNHTFFVKVLKGLGLTGLVASPLILAIMSSQKTKVRILEENLSLLYPFSEGLPHLHLPKCI